MKIAVETVRSQMSLRQDPTAQLSEQQAISSRLEQVQYIAPSGMFIKRNLIRLLKFSSKLYVF